MNIQNGKGTKTVEILEKGMPTKRSTKKLTVKEVECIRKCQFIPGLFKDCQDCLKTTKKTRKQRR